MKILNDFACNKNNELIDFNDEQFQNLYRSILSENKNLTIILHMSDDIIWLFLFAYPV